MQEQTHHKDPQFGHHLGFWYPLAWRLLATNKYWSPSMWLPKESALAIDIYIGSWWLLEFLCIVLCNNYFHWQGTGTWIFTSLILFRLTDLMFVLSSILVKGFYRKQGDWPSVNRITLLVILNAIELMVMFAILYRALGILTPEIAMTNPELKNFFDALYFSFVTGTSLGYGTPHPVGWLSRLLAILESSSIVLVVIAVIGYITGEKRKSLNTEQKQD
ncbi:MAG: hypothetical protein HY094_01540 [Candidatus Melainabacteria bacterium]|nr:hypothetical protein [Candidatus Melainabacteria bacterium]